MKEYLIFWSIPCVTILILGGVVLWRLETSLKRLVASIGDSAEALQKGFKATESALYKLKTEQTAIASRQAALKQALMEEWKEANTTRSAATQREIAALIKTLTESSAQTSEIGTEINESLRSLGTLTDMRNLLAKGMPHPGGVHV